MSLTTKPAILAFLIAAAVEVSGGAIVGGSLIVLGRLIGAFRGEAMPHA